MTTSIDRKALDRAEGLMASVGGAMRNVSASLAGIATPEDFKSLHDAALVEVKFPDLSSALADAFSYIADGWTEIRDNEVRLYEVFLFARAFLKFKEAADVFDDILNNNTAAPELFVDPAVGSEYYLLVSKYASLLSPVLSAMEGKNGNQYAGLAEALSGYIRKADDATLEGIISGCSLPEKKLRWTGNLNDATLFGQYFGLTCKWMNDCFSFRDKAGKTTTLNYTHNRLYNKVEVYPIFDILVKFSPAE